MNKILHTSESVTEGHPDKMCDLISDAVLDEIMRKDPLGRVACEVCTTTGLIMIMGEITTNAYVDIAKVARNTVREIGYIRGEYGFDADTCSILTCIDEQSTDIALGVNNSLEEKEKNANIKMIGAGDQGMMFGYATNETDEYMPYPIVLAHKLAKRLTDVRKDELLSYLRPDGKTQVTMEYDKEGNPLRVDAIVCSAQHDAKISHKTMEEDLIKYVCSPIVPEHLIDKNTKFYINPTGRFVIGGPHGDSGLTGRKIIVDTYGGFSHHGGGAFSGKDCTKVDRSAAYMARYIAKNIVASGAASKCKVRLSYAIGVSNPISIGVDTFGTGNFSDNELIQRIEKNYDLTPDGIIKNLDLRKPIYKQTAAYGHFGRNDINLPWEKLDRISLFQ